MSFNNGVSSNSTATNNNSTLHLNGGTTTTPTVVTPFGPLFSPVNPLVSMENTGLNPDTTNSYQSVPGPFDHLSSEMRPEEKLSPDRALNCKDIIAEVTCGICLNIIWDAQQVRGCGHSFCADCIYAWQRQSRLTYRLRNRSSSFDVFGSRTPYECPTCRSSSLHSDSNFVVDKIIDQIKVIRHSLSLNLFILYFLCSLVAGTLLMDVHQRLSTKIWHITRAFVTLRTMLCRHVRIAGILYS